MSKQHKLFEEPEPEVFYRGKDMRPDQANESNAEVELYKRCQSSWRKRELLECPRKIDTFILLDGEVSWAAVGITEPDIRFDKAKVAVYVDGAVHKRRIRELRDKEITEILEKMGWKVLRFPYVRASEKWFNESMAQIIFNVNIRSGINANKLNVDYFEVS